jgi:hypothetical protein
MRLLLWSLVLTAIFLLGYIYLVWPQTIERRLPVHKTLYLDRDIYNGELYHIAQASLEWSEATNNMVIFDIQRLPCDHINWRNAVFIFNATPDYPDVIYIDAFSHQKTLGFYNDDKLPSIGIVDHRIAEEKYTQIVLHELGHVLLLEHPSGTDGHGTLMNVDIDNGSDHITYSDLLSLCEIYQCNATKFSHK